jgi:hypothetical protein
LKEYKTHVQHILSSPENMFWYTTYNLFTSEYETHVTTYIPHTHEMICDSR